MDVVEKCYLPKYKMWRLIEEKELLISPQKVLVPRMMRVLYTSQQTLGCHLYFLLLLVYVNFSRPTGNTANKKCMFCFLVVFY